MQRGRREMSCPQTTLPVLPCHRMVMLQEKKNNLLVSGLVPSPSMSHLTHSLGQRFQSKLLLCTLSSQRGDQNYKVWASASIFPLILSMPCCCCGVFWLVVCALGEEPPLLRSLGTICTPNPIRKDKDLGFHPCNLQSQRWLSWLKQQILFPPAVRQVLQHLAPLPGPAPGPAVRRGRCGAREHEGRAEDLLCRRGEHHGTGGSHSQPGQPG